MKQTSGKGSWVYCEGRTDSWAAPEVLLHHTLHEPYSTQIVQSRKLKQAMVIRDLLISDCKYYNPLHAPHLCPW